MAEAKARRSLSPAMPPEIARLTDLFRKLPGCNALQARRYTVALALGERGAAGLAEQLVVALDALQELGPCELCRGIARVGVPCPICADTHRDPTLLCVVERAQHVLGFEASGAMRGRYFVLGRLADPLEGTGAEDLPLAELLERVGHDTGITEVLLALPATTAGDMTGMHLARVLEPLGRRITKIACGVRADGDLAAVDELTMAAAVGGRNAAADCGAVGHG